MSTQHNDIFLCPNPIDFKDAKTKQRYENWTQTSKLLQIRYIAVLTGLLYIIASIVDHIIAPKNILPLMTTFHLYILPPFLFLIFFLSFKPRAIKVMVILLILAPIIATIGNLIIVSNIELQALRLTEVYLILFWIFTVSGLTLRLAIISGSITFLLIFIVTSFYYEMSTENYVMHCFWMISAYSFGLLSAYLLEHSNRSLFINEEKLKQLAVTDKLTGLYNRTKLDEVLREELARSKRYQKPFGLVLLDFDYFKEVNDTYGHQVGDETLKEIAKLITDHLRSTDKAVRWGGEEFILIYMGTDKEEVLKLAESLRQKIAAYTFKRVGTRTASFGVTLCQDDDTIDTIVQRADQALYEAKDNGRNKVVFKGN